MGATKTDEYTESQILVATLAKAIGHPARVAIIEYLMKVDSCICGDIVDVLPLAQPTVSRHLKELKNAGLIRGNVIGNSICYCIDKNAVDTLQTYFAGLIHTISIKDKTCC
ncbi:MAG: metalloregulator ArsR/SmtB family transcription factor [Balneolales bacterium]|nr:metalloregulator ArsR/SmtB family transcription factor [Balneolales bacterium]